MANNKYVVDNDPAVKNYQVADDKNIADAGFSNQTKEEQRLKAEIEKYSTKSTAACVLLSVIHCHYFYVGRIGRGIITLCTANFLYIGFIIDLIIIIAGKFKDKQGRYVNSANRYAAEKDLEFFYRSLAEGR